MAENKCPCLIVYNSRLGERLMGSGSQSDKYIVERTAIDSVKSKFDGTLAIDGDRCVTLPNGITGIANSDIPSLTDSQFMILFNEPMKNMSVEGRPAPLDDIDYSTIQSITFDINQVANSLTFALSDTYLTSYGYFTQPSIRTFTSGYYGSTTHTVEFTLFDPLGVNTSWLDTTPGTVQQLFLANNIGSFNGPQVIKRIGDIKVLMKYDLTLGTFDTPGNGRLTFEIGFYDSSSSSPFNKISNAAWTATRAVSGDTAALDRRHYTGHFIYDTALGHSDRPDFVDSQFLTIHEGFSLLRPLAIRTVTSDFNPSLVMTNLRLDYKWYC
jgi:hypothetical protein